MTARIVLALLAGLLFGLGLTISQMINPAKVLGFLDLAGDWDPSLILVMAGAIGVATPCFALGRRRQAPLLEARFDAPAASRIDARLLLGAALFGIGWGLVGFCPGPALAAMVYAGVPGLIFLAAMLAGMACFRAMQVYWFQPKR